MRGASTAAVRLRRYRRRRERDRPSFGIDIGGSGMKAAPVDLATGDADGRTATRSSPPARRRPRRWPPVVAELVEPLRLVGPDRRRRSPASCATASIHSAANVDQSWLGTDADALFTKAVGADVHVVNDADAAGLAEVRYGAGRDRARRRARADVRHRHRLGPVRRRHARAQHRARPPRGRRPRRRDAGRGQRPRPRGPVVEGVGRAGRALPRVTSSGCSRPS